jgi:hypothetical protein
MRNSTKLKTLLIKYTITLDRDEDEVFKQMLTDKQTNDAQLFEGSSYASVLSQAYSFLLKEIKLNKDKSKE